MNSNDLVRLYDLIDKAKPDDVKDALKEALIGLAGAVSNSGEVFRSVERVESILKGEK